MTGEGTDPNAGTYHPQTQTTVQTTATSITGTASTEQTRATEIGASASTRQAPQAQKTQAPPTPSEEQFANQPVRSIKVGNVTVLDRYPAEYKEWYEKNTPTNPAPSDFYYSWDVQPNSNLPVVQLKGVRPEVQYNAKQYQKEFEGTAFTPTYEYKSETQKTSVNVASNVEGFTASKEVTPEGLTVYSLNPTESYWSGGVPVSNLSAKQKEMLGIDSVTLPQGVTDAKVMLAGGKMALEYLVPSELPSGKPTDYSYLQGKQLSEAPQAVQNLFPNASPSDIFTGASLKEGKWNFSLQSWQSTKVWVPIQTEGSGKHGRYVSESEAVFQSASLSPTVEGKQMAQDVRIGRSIIPQGTVLTNIYRENSRLMAEYVKPEPPQVIASKDGKVDWSMDITYKNFKMGNQEQKVRVPSIAGAIFNQAGPNETLTTKNFKLGNQPYTAEVNPVKSIAGIVGSVEGIVNPNVPTAWQSNSAWMKENPQYGIGAMMGEVAQWSVAVPSTVELGVKAGRYGASKLSTLLRSMQEIKIAKAETAIPKAELAVKGFKTAEDEAKASQMMQEINQIAGKYEWKPYGLRAGQIESIGERNARIEMIHREANARIFEKSKTPFEPYGINPDKYHPVNQHLPLQSEVRTLESLNTEDFRLTRRAEPVPMTQLQEEVAKPVAKTLTLEKPRPMDTPELKELFANTRNRQISQLFANTEAMRTAQKGTNVAKAGASTLVLSGIEQASRFRKTSEKTEMPETASMLQLGDLAKFRNESAEQRLMEEQPDYSLSTKEVASALAFSAKMAGLRESLSSTAMPSTGKIPLDLPMPKTMPQPNPEPTKTKHVPFKSLPKGGEPFRTRLPDEHKIRKDRRGRTLQHNVNPFNSPGLDPNKIMKGIRKMGGLK